VEREEIWREGGGRKEGGRVEREERGSEGYPSREDEGE